MKRIWIMLIVFFGIQLYAQVNTYFNNNPVWTVFRDCAWSPGCIESYSENYYVNGDTIFDTLVYKKIYKKGEVTTQWISPWPNTSCFTNYWYIETNPSYFLRSIDKKMYQRISATSEQLIYDFDMQVGDSLHLFCLGAPDVVIDSLDSVSTPNGYMNIFYFQGWQGTCYVLEGAGHNRGLREPYFDPIECNWYNACYSLNDTIYPSLLPQSCNINLGAVKYDLPEIKVYPNPVRNECMIQFSSVLKDATISIVDLQGKTVKIIPHVTGENMVFNRENIPGGIYLLKVEEGGNVVVKKLVIQE